MVSDTHHTLWPRVARAGVTHIETLLLWHAYEREGEEDDLIANFGELRENLNASGVALDYLIDCKYNEVSQRLFLFGGTHDGGIDIYHVNMVRDLDAWAAYRACAVGARQAALKPAGRPRVRVT